MKHLVPNKVNEPDQNRGFENIQQNVAFDLSNNNRSSS